MVALLRPSADQVPEGSAAWQQIQLPLSRGGLGVVISLAAIAPAAHVASVEASRRCIRRVGAGALLAAAFDAPLPPAEERAGAGGGPRS